MANTIQVKRGANASLPILNAGEFGFSTDSHQIYIGDGAANHELIKRADLELLNDVSDYVDSPTIITGGEITEGTNAGTFKVAALTALLRTTDSNIGRLKYITKSVEDNIVITAADIQYYIVLNYNAGSPTISLIDTLQAFNNEIPLGSVMKDASNNVHYISGCYRLQDGVAKLHYRAFELYNLYLTEGNTIAYSGTNNFTLTAGVVYEGINRLTQIAYDSAVTTFIPVYRNGSGGWTEGAGRNTIDYEHYDDGDGTLGVIGNMKYGCHWVFRHVDDDAVVYVVYGQGSYSLAEAEVTEVPATPDHLTNFGCLIGRIVVPQAGESFASIQMVTDVVFTGQSVATHNDLGGLNAGDYKHLTAAEKTKFNTLEAASDIAYGVDWNGVTTIAPSKNAVYDEMETKADKGVNADITSTTVLTQITRVTGGAFDIAIGGASGDDFTIATNKFVVEGDTGNVGIGGHPSELFDILDGVNSRLGLNITQDSGQRTELKIFDDVGGKKTSLNVSRIWNTASLFTDAANLEFWTDGFKRATLSSAVFKLESGLRFEADQMRLSSIPEYTDNAAAITGGLVAGDFYRNGDSLKIVH